MKRFKKMLSAIVAMVMVLAMALPAMAEGTGTEPGTTGKSITIEPSATVEITEESEFKAYKILDAVVAGTNDEGKTEISYTVPDNMKAFYLAQFPTLTGTEKNFAYLVTEAIRKTETDGKKNEFAKAALAYVKDSTNSVASVGSGAFENPNYVISGLDVGYYLVSDESQSDVVSQVILDTTIDDLTLTMKADAPTLDKKIVGSENAGNSQTGADTDPTTDGLVSANNAAVGDRVPYELKTKVPSMEGFKQYKFVITDTLSKGLTYNDDLKVFIGNTELTKNTDYKVTITPDKNIKGEHVIKITFINFIGKQNLAGSDIYIGYTATLNEDAVMGIEGNPNKAYLQYSKDRETEEEGEPDDDIPDKDPDNVYGKTPEQEVRTFVTGLELEKVNGQGQKLEGARFKIKGNRLNKVWISGIDYEKDPNGSFYKLTDGTYTEEEPREATDTSEGTKHLYVILDDGSYDKYNEVTIEKWSDGKTDETEVELEATVDGNGKLVFKGLAAGTYTISELIAPDGYNMLKDNITVTITCDNAGGKAANCTWTGSYEIGEKSGNLTPAGEETLGGILTGLKVVNNTGTELPSTGGIGTTIFYIIGGILVVGAAILLVTKKRMSKEA